MVGDLIYPRYIQDLIPHKLVVYSILQPEGPRDIPARLASPRLTTSSLLAGAVLRRPT